MKTLLLLIIIILLVVLVFAVVSPDIAVKKDGSVRYRNVEVYKPEPTPDNIVNRLLGK